jgi:hypothetical protein
MWTGVNSILHLRKISPATFLTIKGDAESMILSVHSISLFIFLEGATMSTSFLWIMTHPCNTMISAILQIHHSPATALAIRPDKKDKSYVCPSQYPVLRMVHSTVLFNAVFS